MRTIIIAVLAVLSLLAVGGFFLKRKLSGMAQGARIIIVMQRLGQAATELRERGTFTNDVPQLCEIYRFTNDIMLAHAQHRCVLAARSPMFAERGFMAITTNDTLVWIDRDGKATPFNGPDAVTP